MPGYSSEREFLLVAFCLLTARVMLAQAMLSEAERQLILNEHNQIRSSVTPSASNMEMMV